MVENKSIYTLSTKPMNTLKKHKTLHLLLLFFCTSNLFSQNFAGTIVDAAGEPIEFATVYIDETSCGTHSNSTGQFKLTCDQDLHPDSNFLIISYVGYNSKKIAVGNFQKDDTLVLTTINMDLALVEIVEKKSIKMEDFKFEYAIKKPYFYYQTDVVSNYQLASRIANENQHTGYLSELKFKVGKVANTKTPTRILFYSVDPACNCPGKPINTTDIIVTLKSGRNKVDLGNYAIEIPKADFYIVFEWLHNPDKETKKLDFSIGMIPFKSEYPLMERKGGLNWQPIRRSGSSRIWTQLNVLSEQK